VSACVEFLQWALPRLGMRWAGFRKVRGQVCRRLRRRVAELGLRDLAAYRDYLAGQPEEWAVLEGLVHITISRFYRDRGVFTCLEREVLPALVRRAAARAQDRVDVWSAGCASGEEPYTLAAMWELAVAPRAPGGTMRILATDVDDAMLERARRGCYAAGSLRELPEGWRAAGFVQREGHYCVTGRLRALVTIARHDVRDPPPSGRFDLALCRNLAFTYFDEPGQCAAATHLAGALRPGGALVLGKHEALPAEVEGLFDPWSPGERVYRRVTAEVSGLAGTRETGSRITPSSGSPSAECPPARAIRPVSAPTAASTRSDVES
jgi:chemotaxis protein methyltransferase CheR